MKKLVQMILDSLESTRTAFDDPTTVADVLAALEDGAYLAELGLTDSDINVVEGLCSRLEAFGRKEEATFALTSIEARLEDENATLFVVTKKPNTVTIECMTVAEFCDKHGIVTSYAKFREDGAGIDDVYDCSADEAHQLVCNWLREGSIDGLAGGAMFRAIRNLERGQSASRELAGEAM